MIIFVVFLLCFSFINQALVINVLAQEDTTPEKPKGILQWLLQGLGHFWAKNFGKILIFTTEATAADPPWIEISYNETVTFNLGMLNASTKEFFKFDVDFPIYNERYLTFEAVEYPSGNEYGKWLVTFNPTTVKVEMGTVLKTNVSVTLRSPRMADKPIQNGILKIRIYDKWVCGSVYWPKKGGANDKFILRGIWFALSRIGGWGKQLSGHATVTPIDVDVLVKVKPYHSLKFDAVPYLVFRPDEIVSIPITIQNLGNYNDTFSFRVVSEHDDIIVTDPTSITLAPGETSDTYLGVTIPPSVFDYGTIHQIKLEAYSIDQENVTIAKQTITLESKGVYFSELNSLGIVFLIFIFILFVLFIIIRRRRLMQQICVKPDKPWEIPEEEEYLEKLKNDDKQKYDEVLKMMKDEYHSALLWYDSYVKSIIQQKPVKKEKLKTKEVKKEKAEEKIDLEQKKKEKEDIKIIENLIEKKEKIIIDNKVRAEKLKKEKTLQKIKRDQEKQRQKITKSNSS